VKGVERLDVALVDILKKSASGLKKTKQSVVRWTHQFTFFITRETGKLLFFLVLLICQF
jgi:hypothetical protein